MPLFRTLATCKWQEERNEHIPCLRLAILGDVCKINGFFTWLPRLPPSLIYKQPGIQTLRRQLFWGASLPCSWSAAFWISFLASTPHLSDSLAHCMASRGSLDSVTKAHMMSTSPSSPWWISGPCSSRIGFKNGSYSHLLLSKMTGLTKKECSPHKAIWDKKNHPWRVGTGWASKPGNARSLLRNHFCKESTEDRSLLSRPEHHSLKCKPSTGLISCSLSIYPSTFGNELIFLCPHTSNRKDSTKTY